VTQALARQFDRCWPHLEPALAIYAETDRAGLLAQILSGRAQLWPGERSAVVTQCLLKDYGPTIHTWLAGGTLDELLGMRPGIEAFGRAMGCMWATGEGRKGWARVFRQAGYEPFGTALRKML
jgi:hypothetical protein